MQDRSFYSIYQRKKGPIVFYLNSYFVPDVHATQGVLLTGGI
jgi:hypothetical protein